MIELSEKSRPVIPALKKFLSKRQLSLIPDLEERERIGIERYGKPLHTHSKLNNKVVDLIQMMFEEGLDAAIYGTGAIMEIDEKDSTLRADLEVILKEYLFTTNKVKAILNERAQNKQHTPITEKLY